MIHILNAPDHELPQEVLASMSRVAGTARDDGADTAAVNVFERIIEVAGRADLAKLDEATLARSRPLADFAVELTMISATRPDIVAEVSTDADWLAVRRGSAGLSRDEFRLDDCWRDYFGYLTNPTDPSQKS